MSNTAHDGVDHTVTRGEVEVSRHLEADGRGIVGTVELRSRAAEPALVEVTQPIPTELSVESMAFKPEASPEFKDVSGDHITFRQTVEDEPVRVVFGIMLTESVEELAFAPPSIDAADPVGATRGEAATDPTPDGEVELDVESTSEGDEEDDPVADASGPSPDTDAEALVDAADGVNLDADEPAETGTGGTDRRSVELRVDRLSARVEEFATYAGALESFIDEKGTAPEFVDRVESRVDEIDDRVTATREDLDDEVGEVRADLETEVASVREETTAETDELREELETTRSEVTALRDDLETVRSDVTELREEVATLSDDVEELTGMRESLASALSDGPLAEPPATGDAGDD